MITVGILGICHLIWFFAFKGSPLTIFILIVAYILSGTAWGGINVAL